MLIERSFHWVDCFMVEVEGKVSGRAYSAIRARIAGNVRELSAKLKERAGRCVGEDAGGAAKLIRFPALAAATDSLGAVAVADEFAAAES